MRLIPLLFLLAASCLPEATVAKDIHGEFAVFSVGANTCKEYLSARRQGGTDFDTYQQWLSGYLSAFNLIVVDTYDIMGQHSYRRIIRWLDDYCDRNPQESFINASAALTISLYPKRHSIAPKDTTNDPMQRHRLYSAEK